MYTYPYQFKINITHVLAIEINHQALLKLPHNAMNNYTEGEFNLWIHNFKLFTGLLEKRFNLQRATTAELKDLVLLNHLGIRSPNHCLQTTFCPKNLLLLFSVVRYWKKIKSMTNKRESKVRCCSQCTTYRPMNIQNNLFSSNTSQHVWWIELYAPLLVYTLTKEHTITPITF